MRPIKLTISAFGPYADEAIVDFEKIGESGLYLIYGDTGSGKTTIFDAISFALFGSPTGDTRNAANLRSDFAEPTTKTFVDLTFVYRDKTYRIVRSPRYERPAKRGGGTTTEQPQAELHLPDGTVETKTSVVDAKIATILGVTKSQYEQIAMIAQGEFKKLLNAKTKDRAEIFRNIFSTAPYEAFQNELKMRANSLRSAHEKAQERISSLAQQVSTDLASDYAIELDRMISLGVIDTDKLKDVIHSVLEADKKDADELSLLDQKNREALQQTESDLTTAQHRRSLEESFLAAEKELAEAQLLLNDARNKREEAREFEPELSVLPSKIDEAQRLMQLFDDVERAAEELKDATKSHDIAVNTAESLRAHIVASKSTLDNLLAQQATLTDRAAQYRDICQQIEHVEQECKRIDDDCYVLDKAIKDITEATAALDKSQARYQRDQHESERASDELRVARRIYLDNQAGILASGLMENSPCPVCGSTVHPHLASLIDSAPSKEEIESLESTATQRQNTAAESSAACARVKALVEERQTHLISLEDRLGNRDSLTEAAISQKALLEQLKTERIALGNPKAEIKKAEAETERTTQLIEKLSQQQADLDQEVIDAQTRVAITQSKLAEKTAALEKESASDKNELVSRIESMTKRKQELETLLDKAQSALAAAQSRVVEASSKIDTLREQLERIDALDIDKLNAKKEELHIQIEALDEKIGTLNGRIAINEKLLSSIEKELKETERIRQEYGELSVLADVACGTLKGSQRISFETYVQTIYFDMVVEASNARLALMAGGRFELRRKASDTLSGKTGLDLDVFDRYTGKSRDVSTLSGGESFEASLCLALGLSDVVQGLAGGIQFDSMFIDEGFGSLDDESLANAIQMLAGLSTGNRLIGIISHVDELKNAIDRKIMVRSGVNGSSLEVIV